jgi:chromosomal replication initiator protein
LGSEYFSTPVNITLVLGERVAAVPNQAAGATVSSAPEVSGPLMPATPAARKAPPADKDRSAYERTRLISTFTFENLVVGKANDLARAAARQVAISPGETTYNPLFIYGGAGLGKTHLVHAIGNQILEHCPEKVVRYVHAEDYYSDVVRAYQQKAFDTIQALLSLARPVLLVDDIQFFNGNKARTQEEFFYVVQCLDRGQQADRHFSCDTYPTNTSRVSKNA